MIEKQIFLPGPDEKSSESFKEREFLSFAFCFLLLVVHTVHRTSYIVLSS